jgi:uncharacterized protein (TIGR03435 family)
LIFISNSSLEAPDASLAQNSLSNISPAIEKQLGLKLNASKVSQDVIKIDHVQRMPTAD